MNFEIQKAKANQIDKIKNLLAENNLPIEDILFDKINFFSVTKNENLIGAIGAENYQNIALLRSLVVDKEFRNHELGKRLVETLIQFCKSQNVDEIFLLTTTANFFFEKLGFENIERRNVPEKIMQTEEFKSLCPSSAIVMCKKINL